MGIAPAVPPLLRLIQTFRKEKIRFQIAGKSAAILQGTPATTLDTDIWIDLAPRQYLRILNLSRKLNAEVLANTVVSLEDESIVNFLYRVDGLNSFAWEYGRAKKIVWMGEKVRVLPLQRIIQSKKYVGREKDLAHIPLLEKTLALIQNT